MIKQRKPSKNFSLKTTEKKLQKTRQKIHREKNDIAQKTAVPLRF